MAALANPTVWYVKDNAPTSTIGWSALTAWSIGATITAGSLIRQLATPTVGNERAFACIIAGTTGGSEPTWTVTKGAKTTDNTVTWIEVTGQPAVCGDLTNTQDWNAAKSNTVALGQIIKRLSGASYQICTTAGTAGSGSEPAFSDTAGVTTSDNTVTWTSLGAVGNFTAWKAPHARVANALASTWSTAGNSIYVSNNHTETQAAVLTLAGQGTTSSLCNIVCVNDSVAPPTAVATGAAVATTGAFKIAINGCAYYQGMAFSAAGGGSNNAGIATAGTVIDNALYFENCALGIASTNATPTISLGLAGTNTDALVNFLNCTFTFGATGQKLVLAGETLTNVLGGSVAATGSVPTTMFSATGPGGIAIIRDCDLSAVTGTLMAAGGVATAGIMTLENCKIGVGVTPAASTNFAGPGGALLRMHNCDSGSKNYRFYERSFLALVQQDTTIVRSGGATDGATPISWSIATTANTSFVSPYVSQPIEVWINTTGSPIIFNVEIAGANTLTNGDIWMVIESLNNASFPIGTLTSNRVADILTATANVTTSAASWSGSPAHTQKLQVTATPLMAGVVKARIYVARASTTVNIDPIITGVGFTSGRQYQIPGQGYINEGASSGVSVTSGYAFC